MHVGIDIEQFVRDPMGSGIQRVLQYLAREWPSGEVPAEFVVPVDRGHGLLTPQQAADLLSLPFAPRAPGADLRDLVGARIAEFAPVRVKDGALLALFDRWLLPEVSYLPGVLERFERFSRCLPTAMIGYDVLPMSEPANYRFRPGTAAWVSEYFRHLATADSVVAISGYARDSILRRLRRDPARPITVAHPGGDHLDVRPGNPPQSPAAPRFLRLGTLEARKRPLEILEAFTTAAGQGLEAELVFVGAASSSDFRINDALAEAVAEDRGVDWIQGASDEEVCELVNGASAFLALGVEGYGIPVLEAIRLGTPVLYDGVQPAAEIMQGRGSRRIAASTAGDLAAELAAWSRSDVLDELRAELRPTAVPAWRDFVAGVVRGIGEA